jgi:hypothetical protein
VWHWQQHTALNLRMRSRYKSSSWITDSGIVNWSAVDANVKLTRAHQLSQTGSVLYRFSPCIRRLAFVLG